MEFLKIRLKREQIRRYMYTRTICSFLYCVLKNYHIWLECIAVSTVFQKITVSHRNIRKTYYYGMSWDEWRSVSLKVGYLQTFFYLFLKISGPLTASILLWIGIPSCANCFRFWIGWEVCEYGVGWYILERVPKYYDYGYDFGFY